MLRRRRLQFSLSALFAVVLLSACAAWWFRPGVVKPEFTLDKFARADELSVKEHGKEYFLAHVRLLNAGPDSIRLDPSRFDCEFEGGMVLPGGGQVTGWGQGSWPGQPIGLKPSKSIELIVPLDGPVRTIQLRIEIADHRGRRKATYRSQPFSVPENLFPPDSR